ncbi:hypothetical protein J1605_003494 [Eschrichtius robustus]|uniref:Uncharacterized protein n=1 Tax=Eschrichtius robustus TaxID=9764 RepID=A0AB34HN97_ESCRO|nr:hypothetical protein J1605_003494 [Eschrichtius robustus]
MGKVPVNLDRWEGGSTDKAAPSPAAPLPLLPAAPPGPGKCRALGEGSVGQLGELAAALEVEPTTLPQGTINMNQCTDVVDGEGRTGQKFSLCILTPEKEHFIRAETKEIISGTRAPSTLGSSFLIFPIRGDVASSGSRLGQPSGHGTAEWGRPGPPSPGAPSLRLRELHVVSSVAAVQIFSPFPLGVLVIAAARALTVQTLPCTAAQPAPPACRPRLAAGPARILGFWEEVAQRLLRADLPACGPWYGSLDRVPGQLCWAFPKTEVPAPSLCKSGPEASRALPACAVVIVGWLEMLTVYPRTNKQNQKKKRKVEPPTPQALLLMECGPGLLNRQSLSALCPPSPKGPGPASPWKEPGPAKVAVTSSSSTIPSAEKVPTTKSTLWQEEMRAKDQPDGSSPSPAQSPSQSQPPVAGTLREPGLESRDEEGTTGSDRADCGRKVRVESGYFSLEKTKQDVKAEEQLPPPLSPPSPGTPPNRYSGSGPFSRELGRPLPPPGPQPSGRTVCSGSFSSLDTAHRPPAHVDSGSAGGRGAERPGRASAFKASRQYATLADVPKAIRISHREAFQVERRRLERRTRARSPGREEVARLFGNERR